jgi:hypothetical protein
LCIENFDNFYRLCIENFNNRGFVSSITIVAIRGFLKSLLEWIKILGCLLSNKRLLKSGESFVLAGGGGVPMRDVPGRAQLVTTAPTEITKRTFHFLLEAHHTNEAPHEVTNARDF